MTISGSSRKAILAAALATTCLVSALPAHAQGGGLLGIIFGEGNRMNRPYDERYPQNGATRAPQRAPAARGSYDAPPRLPVAKVSSPTFLDYKAVAPVPVDFSRIEPVARDDSFLPQLSGASFREALPALSDFDLTAEKQVADALVKYYSENPDFVWVSGFSPNGQASDVEKLLDDASSYGLSESDYKIDVPDAGYDPDQTAARFKSLMRFEMEMSARVLRYALDAHNGRVDPNKLSGYHDLPAKKYDLVALLKEFSKTGDAVGLLESQHPQNPEYKALRADLDQLRASPEQDIVVSSDILVHPGESNADFPKILEIIKRDGATDLIAEFGDLIDRNAANETYDRELVPVIKAAQKAKGLHPDGVIGPRTVQALAGESKASRVLKDELAMERLRWLPSNLGNPHVLINAAAFTAAFNRDGQNKLLMRAVVGKKTNQTSFFYDEIEYVEFNPYWGVPRSIIINEMLPRLVRDPGYLDRAGYEVTDSKGRHIPSAAIDWARVGTHIPYNVRQVPSEENALGELKIMFPNKHAIYMHDTPAKSLFSRDVRDFSHGCVRLQQPRDMAAAVLGWDIDEIRSHLAQGHNRADVPKKIPVYVAYFTAWPDDQGKVSFYNDVYDRDSHLETALEKVEAARQPSLKIADGAD